MNINILYVNIKYLKYKKYWYNKKDKFIYMFNIKNTMTHINMIFFL